jgi:hypothetical protein
MRVYDLDKQIVREGEWNEAICFSRNNHPKIEIAAQYNGYSWFVYYLSPSRARTLLNAGGSKDTAIVYAHWVAENCLGLKNPYSWINQNYH